MRETILVEIPLMKKRIALILAVFFAFSLTAAFPENALAERVYVRGEIRETIDMTEEQLAAIMNESYQNGLSLKLYDMPVHAVLIPPADENFRLETRFFGSLNEMLMALDAGLIDGACMPEFTGKYLLARNDDLRAGMFEFSNVKERYYLGFYNNTKLRDQVNEALSAMKADGTLYALQEKYLRNLETDPVPARLDTFEGAQTIRVAVTGDLPPMDYTAEDGSPAGFNTALLSELGKRLKVNIEITNIESSARTLSLTSGVVDMIFWYLYGENYVVTDRDDGIQLSDPYYSLDNWFYIEKK